MPRRDPCDVPGAGLMPVVVRGSAGRMLVALMLVASTVGWRRGQYFSGSLDPVVVGKGALSLLALALAFLLAQAGPRRRVGTGTLWFLAVMLASSVFGAFTYGTLLASGVVAFRVLVLAITLFFFLRAATVSQIFSSLAWACGAVGLAATVTGLGTMASGRLQGGLPPLTPNELALLASIVVLYVGWRIVLGRVSWPGALTAVVSLGVIWATGSRTALLALVVALVVMAFHIRRARAGLVVGALVVAGLGVVGMVVTGAFASFLERNGTGTSTLDSRFIAWRAAWSWADSIWQQLCGGGLSVKIIQVHAQWWNQQPLDSSWVSMLVQAGFVGLLVTGCWVLWTLRGCLRAPHPMRALFLPALVFFVGRSVLESGLFDATPAFLGFFAVSLLVEGGSRARLRDEARGPVRRPRSPMAQDRAAVREPADPAASPTG